MTIKLTDEQVKNAATEAFVNAGPYTEIWLRNFADRIAALAVQEVERVGCVDRHGYLDIPVTQEVDSYIRIHPADAKRIMAMARTGGTE
jgi:uncharacterized membrane protein